MAYTRAEDLPAAPPTLDMGADVEALVSGCGSVPPCVSVPAAELGVAFAHARKDGLVLCAYAEEMDGVRSLDLLKQTTGPSMYCLLYTSPSPRD